MKISKFTAQRTFVAIVAAASAATLASTHAEARSDIAGIWFNDTKEAAIELNHCETSFCGRIVWLRRPLSRKTGQPIRDARNPSPARRNAPICGLQIISQIRPQSDGSWDKGRIYDPKVGKEYKVAIEKLGPDRLRVIGYIGARLFGRSFEWQRAPNNLERCG